MTTVDLGVRPLFNVGRIEWAQSVSPDETACSGWLRAGELYSDLKASAFLPGAKAGGRL